MALTIAEQAQLDDLRQQRNLINSGRAVAEFEFNGQRTAYSKPNTGELNAEIAKLEARASLPATATHRRGGAITFRL